jgi:glutaconyl-CoA/methylmalonyl-CoA decarboxylase subunit delta
MMTMSMIIASMTAIGNDNWTIAIVGYIIVFLALVLLVAVFLYLPRLVNMEARKRMRRKGVIPPEQQQVIHISGEENAAIAMAIYLYFNEMHDEESNIITIRKVSRSYSPWSSKIYGLNSIDRKQF